MKGKSNRFSRGHLEDTENLVMDNNLYWNGLFRVPNGDLLSPLQDDTHRIVAPPLLASNQRSLVLPYWNGNSFLSGSKSIREEFVRLVSKYGEISIISFAKNSANPSYTPPDDILGRARGNYPDIGAYEHPVDFLMNFSFSVQ